MVWMVRQSDGQEWVMRHAVERKTVSDLSASIKDGRYREQKKRLAQSELSHVVSLIEGNLNHSAKYSEKTQWSLLPPATLEAAVASTAYGGSEFLIQKTKDLAATARWLSLYTSQLQRQLEEQRDPEMVFPFGMAEFNERNKKDANPTVSDIFGRQLLSVSGISSKKVNAILAVYPTVSSLLEAYEERETDKERRMMLAEVKLPGGDRNLGPKASNAVAKVFRMVEDE
jgi:crossover junction endonuclease MUS81